jgi:RimJ/RimL family protein N-acetyltransferase
MTGPVRIRRLVGTDADAYRDLRLLGLRDHPEAFGASFESEAAQPLAWFAERVERTVIFGAEAPADPALLGMVGFLVPEAAKLSHKGVLWGMFVRPEARGAGVGAALVARLLAHAAEHVEAVRLTVVATNEAALRLYARAGFTEYGLERRALKVDGRYYDELLMSAPVSRAGA